MWDTLLRHPRGRISQRYLIFVATGLFAALFLCLGHSFTAFAEDAYRIANGIHYDNKDFTTQVTITESDPRQLTTSSDVYAYEYSDPATKTVEDIYFASQTGRDTATTGQFVKFTVVPPNTYSQQGKPVSITIAPAANAAPTPSQANAGSCNVDGVGWLVCPVSGWIAGMLDSVYNVLMDFLDVQPMLQGGPIFDVWSAVKNIANICFVIVFMLIIFSQVTTYGLSNYGLKKMIPRLIIAAILVNISYWICALGVDLSNFLGHSVYAFLMSFADSFKGFQLDHITWSSLTAGILGATAAGGTVAGLGLFAMTTAGGLPAALFTLLGMLLSVILAAITAVFILMARQALIIVFILVSPLAFVAMVLPKTEKWFDKWKEAFVAMLIMFPLFSLVFGGAMLAGAAIIVSAHNDIFLILLGKGTQLMPLAITPLIVKFSTGALGTIAGMANNRNKGLIDRARKWTDGQAEHYRKKSLANTTKFGRFNPARRFAQAMNARSVRQKLDEEKYDAQTQAAVMQSKRYRRSNIESHIAQQQLNAVKGINDAILHEADAGHAGTYEETGIRNVARAQRLAHTAHVSHEQIALNATRKAMAERKAVSNLATLLSSNDAAGVQARAVAAGIMGEVGERSALASAKSNASKFVMEDAKNIEATLDYDISSNANKLYDQFKKASTDAERVAFTSIMAKRGAPGAIKLRQMLTDMDNQAIAGQLSRDALNDYKELVVAQNPNIMNVGKDVEFFFTNASYNPDYGDPELAGKIKTFSEITNEVATWGNLSADAFSRMNIINQFQGLRVLAHKSPEKFNNLVKGVLQSNSARGNLKNEVLMALEQHGGNPNDDYWYNDPDGYNTPKTSELTEFEYHTMFEPPRPAGDFAPREEYPNKTAADWKAAYDAERAKTERLVREAEQRANDHGGTFRPSN